MKCCAKCRMPVVPIDDAIEFYCQPFGTCGGPKGYVEVDNYVRPLAPINPPETPAPNISHIENARQRIMILADQCGALRTERDELLRENAMLRRRVELLERRARPTKRKEPRP